MLVYCHYTITKPSLNGFTVNSGMSLIISTKSGKWPIWPQIDCIDCIVDFEPARFWLPCAAVEQPLFFSRDTIFALWLLYIPILGLIFLFETLKSHKLAHHSFFWVQPMQN